MRCSFAIHRIVEHCGYCHAYACPAGLRVWPGGADPRTDISMRIEASRYTTRVILPPACGRGGVIGLLRAAKLTPPPSSAKNSQVVEPTRESSPTRRPLSVVGAALLLPASLAIVRVV